MDSKIPVGVLGATGRIGQAYVKLLQAHPSFELVALSGSPKWNHHSYREAVSGRSFESFSEKALNFSLSPIDDFPDCSVIFSALENQEAARYDPFFAKKGATVFSHASIHRKADDVPMIIPEINPEHLDLLPIQQQKRQWKGALIVKPNCTLQSFLLPLYPLHCAFNLKQVVVTTLQSTSGGGSQFELEGNIIPHIQEEEEKTETEPLKILGTFEKGEVLPAQGILFSSHCNRVPVVEGHLACITASFEKPVSLKEVLHLWENFVGLPQTLKLPLAPETPIRYLSSLDRPQPLHDLEEGMCVSVGRLRGCSVFDIRFTALSHNLIRGGAGGHLLNAELALALGKIHG